MPVPNLRSFRWMSSTHAFVPSATNALAKRSNIYLFECKPPSFTVIPVLVSFPAGNNYRVTGDRLPVARQQTV